MGSFHYFAVLCRTSARFGFFVFLTLAHVRFWGLIVRLLSLVEGTIRKTIGCQGRWRCGEGKHLAAPVLVSSTTSLSSYPTAIYVILVTSSSYKPPPMIYAPLIGYSIPPLVEMSKCLHRALHNLDPSQT